MTAPAIPYKPAGEPSEAHIGQAVGADLLFDVHAYVDDFNSAVVGAYRRNVADRELPADPSVARSVIPPATAAVRDFSSLAPTLPVLRADACVGCMACVSACPDSAILGIAVAESDLASRLDVLAASSSDPDARAGAAAHFAHTQKYAELPARRGLEPAAFGIFVDPLHCKGCSECVTVCHELGHDALALVAKAAPAATGAATERGPRPEPDTGRNETPAAEPGAPTVLAAAIRDFAFFRSLPVTPEVYRNDKAHVDLRLGEHAFGYVGGAGSCSGCGEATAIRMMVAATRQTYGPEGMAIVAATGCNTVFGSTYPFNPYRVPWTNSLFENAPAVAAGVRSRWDSAGHPERRVWVMGGDGAMYDIGFQALSRLVASGADVKVLVLDGQVYSNTGGQASTASFGGQVTKLSAYGKELHGRPERRKELGRILLAHGEAYVAQTTPAHTNHFYRAILEANEYPGPAVVIVYSPCQPEHGIADDASTRQAKLAVETRAFPLFTFDPRRGASIAERLSLQGNPALRDDWAKAPDGSPIDFLDFARSEGRFAAHFAADGTPTPEITATRDDRLANWRWLQELAGLI
jgi:pyruvate/2-oxoacid:ferredoxin oxidoreductase beta subunit/Pyruvate/2-oxoacid:ferredoxin oxidoreductase delta subunit